MGSPQGSDPWGTAIGKKRDISSRHLLQPPPARRARQRPAVVRIETTFQWSLRTLSHLVGNPRHHRRLQHEVDELQRRVGMRCIGREEQLRPAGVHRPRCPVTLGQNNARISRHILWLAVSSQNRGTMSHCWHFDLQPGMNPDTIWAGRLPERRSGQYRSSASSPGDADVAECARDHSRKARVISFRKAISALLGMLGPSKARPAQPSDWSWTVVQLKHWTGPDRPPPLMWKDCHPRTRATFKAELTCSNGHGVSLRGHSIAADGKVSPSVVCLAPGCSFHDVVRLDGWSAGAL